MKDKNNQLEKFSNIKLFQTQKVRTHWDEKQ